MTLPAALRERVVVLDGGLATELERRGNDLSSALWSARLLRDRPDEIVAAHRAFADSGAEVATTASYQASFDGLGEDAELLMRRSVDLARRGSDGWVAASVGPYGATLADGSEYRGDYGLTVAQLRRWHRPRLAVLADAGADVLAVETIPCLAEVAALLAELDALGFPAWLSLTCDGTSTRAGEPAAEAFAMARDCDAVFAVGVNCTDPHDVEQLVRFGGERERQARRRLPEQRRAMGRNAPDLGGRAGLRPRSRAQLGRRGRATGRRLLSGRSGRDRRRRDSYSARPCSIAQRVSSTRLCSCSFCSVCWMWFCTVRCETTRRCAICFALSPVETSRRISVSRSVRTAAGAASSRPMRRYSPSTSAARPGENVASPAAVRSTAASNSSRRADFTR